MSYGVDLYDLRSGAPGKIPLPEIISVLVKHGCVVGHEYSLGNGRCIGVVRPSGKHELFAEAAIYLDDGLATGFGFLGPIHREDLDLLFSLIQDLKLVMLPSYGGDIYAREDVFAEMPKEILEQFSNPVVVTRPEDILGG